MNRINKLFQEKKQNIFSLYFCAGHPQLDSTVKIIRTLEKKGVDLVEIGIPFSDPLADGPVIQKATRQALNNGMSLRLLFEQLRDIRQSVQIPLVIMGYLNPIMRFGFEAFCQACSECGIDGMIIPDLPFRNYLIEYKPVADRYDLKMIMLITPTTEEERIRLIDRHTEGFIYMVSSAAITGAQKAFGTPLQEYFNRINNMSLNNPRLIGFGISNRQTLETARANAAGTIIGSKFIRLLEEYGNAGDAWDQLMKDLQQ